MTALSRAERVYRALLRCYPGEFRDEYEREMLIAFRERMTHDGRSGMLALWMQVLADAIFRAPAEHLDVLSQDLRYARRSLRRAPVFALMAILTLVLGIGANTAIFSVVHAVALRPLPFADSDRLLRLWEKNDELGISRFSASALNYLSWREQARTLDLAGWRSGSVTLTGTGDPIRVSSAELSPALLPLIGVQPKLGRLFDTGEDRPGGPRVAILSEALWRRHYGSNPTVVGSTVAVSGTPFTVVGLIATDSFPTAAEFFMPLAINVANESRGNHMMSVIGRLKPGVTHNQAQQEMDAIASRLAADFPDSNKGWGVTSATVYDWLIPIEIRNGLYLVLAAVGCVLLIACANVANLMLARATGRRREMALRMAIGAARRRLVRQVLTEGLVLAVLGGGAGILVAVWGVPILQRQLPSTLPRADEAAVNATVLAFSIAVSLLTGVLFGALPAITASRRDVVDSLKEGARGSSGGSRWARQVLVVAQVALATILLVAAGLLVRSLQRLQLVDVGFQPASITTAMMGIPQNRYPKHPQQWSFYQRLMERLAASPGVQSVALSSGAPFGGGNTAMPVSAEGASRLGTTPLQTDWRMVSPNYFSTLGIPLLKGRSFRDSDVEGAPQAMVVSEGMARRMWGDDDPIGRRIIPGQNQPFTVV
jgi:predicted permease